MNRTVFFVSFTDNVGTLGIANLHSEDTNILSANDFLRDATDGWRRYAEAVSQSSSHESSHWGELDGRVEHESAGFIHRRGPLGHSQFTSANGREVVIAKNAEYGFWLVREPGDEELKLRDVLPINDLVQSHPISREVVRRMSHPDYLWRDSLLEVIEKTYFELLAVSHEPTASYPSLYRVDFNYEHSFERGPGELFNWPQKGTLWLDADNCWVIVRCQVKQRLVGGEKDKLPYALQEFEFEPKSDSLSPRLATRRTQYSHLPSDWDTADAPSYVLKWKPIPADEFESAATRLSYYGFAEPVFDAAAINQAFEIRTVHEHLRAVPTHGPKYLSRSAMCRRPASPYCECKHAEAVALTSVRSPIVSQFNQASRSMANSSSKPVPPEHAPIDYQFVIQSETELCVVPFEFSVRVV